MYLLKRDFRIVKFLLEVWIVGSVNNGYTEEDEVDDKITQHGYDDNNADDDELNRYSFITIYIDIHGLEN